MSDRLTLAALLAHPAGGGLHPVAGADPATEWRDLVVGAGETDLPDDGTGLLALLTSAPPATPWQQDALVRRVRDRGYRALAAPGAEGFGPGTRALAERLGLALLAVDEPMALARAAWELVEGRDALTLGYVRRVAQSIEYHADNLADLLRHLSASVGHGVALIDGEGVLLQAGGELPSAVHAAIDFGPWLDTVAVADGSAASVRVDSPSRAGLRLAVFGTGLSTFQLSALGIAAEVAMPAVAARILIDEVADVNDAAVASGLLRDFLERSDDRDAELEQRMLERGWRTTGYHLGFRMIGRSRVDTLQLLRFVTRELTALPLDSHVATSGRGVTGWLSFAAPPAPSRVEEAVRALRMLHASARRSFTVATGIGTLETGPAGLVATIEGAADAARLAADRSATGYFLRIDALGLEQLLLSWTGSDTFVPAAESLLAPLLARGPELVETLTAYLDHESGIAATADALGLHRNTVSTRIARAQELLGLDLADPETRLAVHLACRAVRR
ncbi:helix-turn-helix domain-containing protein [Leifsonia sp. F6_8S_P_1B]|uniref:Helix-turn-helix domain-containing protein n=1 Tax=Leifsonia williamsii TaxID=3035919 RepID=A0ABT8KB41_9MICO|nr:helix-turn-helix domain-containing protein [Leifsonia williamsii]MDN4614644.1 helix-turn-helix domain-containing protein [Leifsonia williamsii]